MNGYYGLRLCRFSDKNFGKRLDTWLRGILYGPFLRLFIYPHHLGLLYYKIHHQCYVGAHGLEEYFVGFDVQLVVRP